MLTELGALKYAESYIASIHSFKFLCVGNVLTIGMSAFSEHLLSKCFMHSLSVSIVLLELKTNLLVCVPSLSSKCLLNTGVPTMLILTW
jgi:hypothetical protein